jgi:transcription antitermination protein NusB
VRRTDQRRAAVIALYQADVTGRPADQLLERDASAFTRELVEGVTREQEALDDLLERRAQGWSIERIAPLERNIMRIATHELLRRSDVPDEVAIDEAVETAKELCSAEAPGFVNGILGAIARDKAAAR